MLDRDLVPGGRVLVPGCGSGYDLATLARDDRTVVGLDLSEKARRAFLESTATLPGTVLFEVADFFSYEPTQPFDFVWDYTFFCALDPDRREDWATAMERLIRPGGLLATLLFPFEDPASDRDGPPWPVHARMVGDLLQRTFDPVEVREVAKSHPGREGRERLALWRRAG
jgi:SAM-dependent methyltransferase